MFLGSYVFVELYLLAGILIIFLAGSLIHFLYGWTKNNFIIGLFSPINESVWEHTKLGLVPTFLYWIIGYFIFSSYPTVTFNSWFTGCLISMLLSAALVPLFFYFYPNIFGKQKLWKDILLFFVATLISQLLGIHVFTHTLGLPRFTLYLAFATLFISYAVFTLLPPNLPIFEDKSKRKKRISYGR